MDNLTHSLVGALIGQMGLKRKTGLAMPTLILAANIPDIDAVATLLDGHQHLAIRRGITHGPIAMLILPLLLWGIMLWFDRWQEKRGTRPEKRLLVHKGWLLALAYIGCLSHPLFDWFNSYGIRLLEPFSSQWYYGDTLFIIDPWLWAALIGGVWLSRRRERDGSLKVTRPAVTAALLIGAYIAGNNAVSASAEQVTMQAVKRDLNLTPKLVVANPVPLQFWKREMLWRDDIHYGQGIYLVPDNVKLTGAVGVHNASRRLSVESDKDAKAFLFWARMPVISVRGEGNDRDIAISDQRFVSPMVGDRFTVRIQPEQLRK